VRAIVPAALAAMALAIAVVYAYYNDPWRPLAHILGVDAGTPAACAFVAMPNGPVSVPRDIGVSDPERP
jgi:hypothetical protein